MVSQHRLDSSPQTDETLPALWRAQGRRVSKRTIVQCIALGTLGTIIPAFLGRGIIVALTSVIVVAFGLYAVIVQPTLGGRWPQPRARRFAGAAVSAIAALAGVAVWLFVLGAIFGGSIEVMRR